jgi:hypothetical protein
MLLWQMNEAARGGDIDGAVMALRLVLQLRAGAVPAAVTARHKNRPQPGLESAGASRMELSNRTQ